MKIPKTAARAFTLIEVTLALGVAGFCLTTIMGLLSVGLSSNQASSEQTVSASIAKAVMADLRTTPAVTGTSSRFGFTVPGSGVSLSGSAVTAAGKPQVLFLDADSSGAYAGHGPVAGKSLYRVTVAFYPAASQMTAAGVRILVTWPALADSGTNSWPVNFTGSCEVLTALDRN